MHLQSLRRGQSIPSPSLLYVNVGWCPHCTRTMPEMQRAAATLGTALPCLSVDGDEHKALVSRLGVQGFPTILFVSDGGRVVSYDGPRTSKRIADWACQQSGRCGLRD